MFFKDIDSWSKKKLITMTAIFASLYFLAATVIPVLIVSANYNLIGKGGNYKLTAAGLIVVIMILTIGRKSVNWITSIMPQETQKQQIFRYSFEMVFALIVPLVGFWVIQLFKKNVELAANTASWCVLSFIVAIIIDNVFLKSLRYQHQCLNEVGHKDKIERIQNAQKNKKD